MRRPMMFLATLALAAGVAAAASAAPTLDANGKCRDGGKFVKIEMCKTPVAAVTGGKCRDIKTKAFAKCGAPGTEAVVTKKK